NSSDIVFLPLLLLSFGTFPFMQDAPSDYHIDVRHVSLGLLVLIFPSATAFLVDKFVPIRSEEIATSAMSELWKEFDKKEEVRFSLKRAGVDILILVILNFIFFLGGYASFLRYDVR
ncbi:MAG: hypothetical protein ACE5PV_10935, partial [Candidatus Poribacteria bacterium]